MSFISADPTGFDGGLNWYLYAAGNSLVYIDENGEHPILIAMAVGAVIGAIIDAAITTATTWNNDDFSWGNVASAAGRGAVSGAITGLAGPAAGTSIKLAMGAKAITTGFKATGIATKAIASVYSGGGSVTGQMLYNYTQSQSLMDGTGFAFAGGFAGQLASYGVKTAGTLTLNQFVNFNAAPKTFLSYLATNNGRSILTSWGVSSGVSAGVSYGIEYTQSYTPFCKFK